MITPEEKIMYGTISEQQPECHIWYDTYGEAVESAKFDQPKYRPYYIVEKTEHYEICGVVDKEDE